MRATLNPEMVRALIYEAVNVSDKIQLSGFIAPIQRHFETTLFLSLIYLLLLFTYLFTTSRRSNFN